MEKQTNYKKIMAEEQCECILNTFSEDRPGRLNTAFVRSEEIKDSPVSECMWFINGHRLMTIGRRISNRFKGIYKTSFSEWRTTFNEPGKVMLM